MKIIITAAGAGLRFQKIGIRKPKYEIIVKGKSLLYWSLISLKKFFNEEFIFIFRKQAFHKTFVEQELKFLGIRRYKIILLNKLTRGQAETIMQAKRFIKKTDSILIYNIDTHISPKAILRSWFNYDGLIVTMKAKGNHWSFAKTGKNSSWACCVSEKKRISDHASVGLYYFKKFGDFNWVFNNYKNDIKMKWNEIYVCPMYQYLIDVGKKILVKDVPIKNVICLGTPNEISCIDPNFDKNN